MASAKMKVERQGSALDTGQMQKLSGIIPKKVGRSIEKKDGEKGGWGDRETQGQMGEKRR